MDELPPAKTLPSRRARLAMVALSTCVALGIAELAVAHVRDHAFPYLNVFAPDPELGVRLQPGARTAVRSFEGRVTQVAIHERGFRGPAWALPSSDPVRLLVLGDSQAFGYHVEFADSFAGRLGAHEGVSVYDAAVPSYGPAEYLAVLEALAPELRPTHVLYVANVGNDWSEVDTRNVDRTTARDGWGEAMHAGRTEPTPFPGRGWLMGRSHLVYALRATLSRVTEAAPPRASKITRLVDDLPRLGAPRGEHRSRLTAPILAANEVARSHGAELLVVTLPLDVQVHRVEWAKYRSAPRDLRATERLAADLHADLAEHGVISRDPLPALRAASPGAFLPDDDHLSPRGHAAVAEVITELLPPHPVLAEAPR